MAAASDPRFARIVRVSDVQGGEPTVQGTRVPVRAIVVTWRDCQDLYALLEAYPRITQADAEEALAYYEAHRAEMDDLIRRQLIGE